MELLAPIFTSKAEAARLKRTGKRHEYWIVGPNYTDSEKEFRAFYDACKRLEVPFDKPGTYNDAISGLMRVSLWGGRLIVAAKSAAHPDSLVGEGLKGVLMVEAAKMKRSVWDKAIRPALADEQGWSLHTSTPEGRNYFYELWQYGQDPANADWESWRMPSWINPHVYADGIGDAELESQRQEMSSQRFAQEIGAEFTQYVGQVFADWDEELHVTDLEYNPGLPLYGAVDYGFTNPTVWLDIQVDAWDNVYVVGEYRVQQRTIEEIATELARTPYRRSGIERFYPDPAGPAETRALSDRLNARAGSHSSPHATRLDLIRRWLKPQPADGRPRLFVDRSCTGLIREMGDYRYPDTDSERPIKKDDHAPDALGYFMYGYFGRHETRGSSGARQSRVRMRR